MNQSANSIVAFSGASGAVYGVRLVQVLLQAGQQVHLMISPAAKAVLQQELSLEVDLKQFAAEQLFDVACSELLKSVLDPIDDTSFDALIYHHYEDWNAPPASGSFRSGGMVVCPCSATTLSGIAHAQAGNLIQRAAEVQLKERRKLILVPRETPLSTLQLDNMHRVSAAGAVVLPASPGWYHGVSSLRDLVDFIVARICDQLGVEVELIRRWGE